MRKTCIQCGRNFNTTNSQKKYCSKKCRENYNNKKQRERRRNEQGNIQQGNIQQFLLDENGNKFCMFCGKPIPKTKNTTAKFCSLKCKDAFHSRQRRKIKHEQNESCPECKNVPEVLPIKTSDNLPVESTVVEKQHYDLHIRAVKDTTGKRYRVDSWINENNPKEQLAELMQQLIRWSFNKAYFTDQEIVEIMTKAYDQSLKDYEE